MRTSLDIIRDTELALRDEVATLHDENDRLRTENRRLLDRLVTSIDLASHRQLLLLLQPPKAHVWADALEDAADRLFAEASSHVAQRPWWVSERLRAWAKELRT